LHWLLQALFPHYHTIADFRKQHSDSLCRVFSTFTHFLAQQDLFGAETVGIDSSRFRAVNSKKNNYNERKIKRHLSLIEQKTALYLQELAASYLKECSEEENRRLKQMYAQLSFENKAIKEVLRKK
jgi:hypothetical protein